MHQNWPISIAIGQKEITFLVACLNRELLKKRKIFINNGNTYSYASFIFHILRSEGYLLHQLKASALHILTISLDSSWPKHKISLKNYLYLAREKKCSL